MRTKILWLCTLLLTFVNAAVLADTIKVAITSKSYQKVAPVCQVFREKFKNDTVEFVCLKSCSGVPEQPVGKEAGLKGAKNRIENLPNECFKECDYVVSIENYIEIDANQQWIDVGLLLVVDLCKPKEEKMVFTKSTAIPVDYVELAKKLSDDEVSKDGFSITVGKAIQRSFPERSIDPQDWHKEIEFGGISRQELISEALFKALFSEEISYLKSLIAYYPDFPKQGILFEDFFPVLAEAKGFQLTIDLLYERYKNKNIEVIVGLESRGFILGAALAHKLNIGFVPIRKPGKLPGMTHSVSYIKEYGTDTLVISQTGLKQNQRVLIIDDLIATGGSAKAAIELVKMAGGIPVEFVSLLQIKELNGQAQLGIPSFNLMD